MPSIPFARRSVPQVWRSIWGVLFLLIPAFRARLRKSRVSYLLVIFVEPIGGAGLFNILVIMAAIFIPRFSQSAYMGISISALILIPLFFLKNIFINREMKNKGFQLIELKDTYFEERSIQIGLALTIVSTVLFIVVGWPLTVLWLRAWTPILITIALLTIDELYASRYFEKSLTENGVCTGHGFIKWDNIESYKWVRKNKKYSTLKVGNSKFYSYWIAYLDVLNVQKEEVDDFFKKKVGK